MAEVVADGELSFIKPQIQIQITATLTENHSGCPVATSSCWFPFLTRKSGSEWRSHALVDVFSTTWACGSLIPKATGKGLFGNRFKQVTNATSLDGWTDKLTASFFTVQLHAFQDH